jgi:hypothetical protein
MVSVQSGVVVITGTFSFAQEFTNQTPQQLIKPQIILIFSYPYFINSGLNVNQDNTGKNEIGANMK